MNPERNPYVILFLFNDFFVRRALTSAQRKVVVDINKSIENMSVTI
jgi:hypothetical protein